MEALLCVIMTFANVLVLVAVSNASKLKGMYIDLLSDLEYKERLIEQFKGQAKIGVNEIEYLRKENAELRSAIETNKLTIGIDTTNAQE